MKRIITASLHHESNTFNPIVTGRRDFSIQYGDELFGVLNDHDSISGIVRTLQDAGCEVVPTVAARAIPNGEVDRDLYRELKEELRRRIRAAAPCDAFVLSLHGSMRVKTFGKAESDLLQALRAEFPDTLLITSLDMHATITPAMIANADGFVGYKQAPHTDCYQTGAHAARMALAALEHGARPTMAACPIPILIAGEKSETSVEPMKSLIAQLRQIETYPGIMAASLLLGFPWADSEENGVCALVVSDGDHDLAKRTAQKIAAEVWSRREEFRFHTESYEPAEAVAVALRAVSRAGAGSNAGPAQVSATTPIFISDSGDNPTAGAAGDNTAFLQLLLNHAGVARLATPLLYAGVYDPAAVARCVGAKDREIDLTFGAAFDSRRSTTTTARVTVVTTALSWGSYQTDLALVRIRNVEVILASQHVGWITPEIFRAVGITPEERQIIVVKLGYLTAPQRTVAKRSIMALTPGNSDERLETLRYRRIRRPIFPLDRGLSYTPQCL